jgi:hypothetical protein
VRIAEVAVDGGDVRAYGLRSPRLTAAYLHRFGDPATPARRVKITLATPRSGQPMAEWIDPATGAVVARSTAPREKAALDVPPFRVDLALLVR